MKHPSPFSVLKSVHDLSLLLALFVGALLIGVSLLYVLKPNDGLLQHHNHLMFFIGALAAISLPTMALLLSPIRRTIKQGCIKAFTEALIARGFVNESHSQDLHEYIPLKKGFMTFHHERVRIYYSATDAPLIEVPRYLLMFLPKGCLT